MQFDFDNVTIGTRVTSTRGCRMTPIPVICPSCRNAFHVPANMKHRWVTCPECHSPFEVKPRTIALEGRPQDESPVQLLARLRRLGMRIYIEGGNLKTGAPRGSLTRELR